MDTPKVYVGREEVYQHTVHVVVRVRGRELRRLHVRIVNGLEGEGCSLRGGRKVLVHGG